MSQPIKTDSPGAGRSRPVTIAIVGADGSGKTSIAKALLASGVVPLKYVYFGPAIGSSTHALPTTRFIAWLRRRHAGELLADDASLPPQEMMTPEIRQRLHRGPVLKTLGLINRIAEEWYRQLIATVYRLRGYSVLCDRHYLYEYCPHSASNRNPDAYLSERIHNWLLARCYPQPDLVLFLDAPASVLYARKPEWTLEYLNKQRIRILEQGATAPNFAVVDAEQPFADVLAEVTQRITGFEQAETAAPVKARVS